MFKILIKSFLIKFILTNCFALSPLYGAKENPTHKRDADESGLVDYNQGRALHDTGFAIPVVEPITHVTYIMLFGSDYDKCFEFEWDTIKSGIIGPLVFLVDRSMFEAYRSKFLKNKTSENKISQNPSQCPNIPNRIFITKNCALILFVSSKLLKEFGNLDALGLNSSNFHEFNPELKPLTKGSSIGDELQVKGNALAEIFSQNSTLEKSIILGGHGSGGFLSAAMIAGLDKKTFACLLCGLLSLQNIKIVIIRSCYAGGVNRIRFFEDDFGQQLVLPFSIVIMNPSDVVSSVKFCNFEKLNKLLKNYNLGNPITSLFVQLIDKKYLNLAGNVGNLPILRSVQNTSFLPIILPDSHACVLKDGYSGNIQIPNGEFKKYLSGDVYYEAPNGKILLFDGFFFPCTLNYEKLDQVICTFISSIPGPSYCVIGCILINKSSTSTAAHTSFSVAHCSSCEVTEENLSRVVNERVGLLNFDGTQRKIFFIQKFGDLRNVIIDLNKKAVFLIKAENLDDIHRLYLLWLESQPFPNAAPSYDQKSAFEKFNKLFWGDGLTPTNAERIIQFYECMFKNIDLLKDKDIVNSSVASQKLLEGLDNLEQEVGKPAMYRFLIHIYNKIKLFDTLVVDNNLAELLRKVTPKNTSLDLIRGNFVNLTIIDQNIKDLNILECNLLENLKIDCPQLKSLNLGGCLALSNLTITCTKILADELIGKYPRIKFNFNLIYPQKK